MNGWIELLEAVIKKAEKDVRTGGTWKRDAETFLQSQYCRDLADICREWRSDCDRKFVA